MLAGEVPSGGGLAGLDHGLLLQSIVAVDFGVGGELRLIAHIALGGVGEAHLPVVVWLVVFGVVERALDCALASSVPQPWLAAA